MTSYSSKTTPYEPQPLSTIQLLSLQRLLQDFEHPSQTVSLARRILLDAVTAKIKGEE